MLRSRRFIPALTLLAACLAAAVGLSAQRSSPGPLRIVLLVDSSEAVAQMVPQFRAGLNAFLDELPEGPEIAIISTGGQLRVRVPPTTDRARLRKAANGFTADGGGNAFLDSLLEADARFLKGSSDRRPVFVIITTDGINVRGEPRVDAYNRFANDFVGRNGRAHAVVVHGLMSGITTDMVINLTQSTGGYYDSMTIANAMAAKMKTMAAMVAADMP